MTKDEIHRWKHGEYSIAYDEMTDKFVVSCGEDAELASRATLREAKEYCDNRDKRIASGEKKKFEPIMAYLQKYSGMPELRKLVSVCENGDVWSVIGGRRSKLDARYDVPCLRVHDDKSVAIVAKAESLLKQARNLEDEADHELKKLKKLELPS